MSVADDWFDVIIPADSMGPKNTFVLAASVKPIKDGVELAVDFGVTVDAVAACRVVDGP